MKDTLPTKHTRGRLSERESSADVEGAVAIEQVIAAGRERGHGRRGRHDVAVNRLDRDRVPETQIAASEDDLRGGRNGGVGVDDDGAGGDLREPCVGVGALENKGTRARFVEDGWAAADTVDDGAVHDEKSRGVVLGERTGGRAAALAKGESASEHQIHGAAEDGVSEEADVVGKCERLQSAGEAERAVGLHRAAIENKGAIAKCAHGTKLQNAGGADCRGPGVGVGRVENHGAAVVGHRDALGGHGVVDCADKHAVGTGEHGGVDIQGGAAGAQAIGGIGADAKRGGGIGTRACVGTKEGLAGANGPHCKRGGEAVHIDPKGAVEGPAIVVESGGGEAAGGTGVVGEGQHGETSSIAIERDRADVGTGEPQDTAREDGHRTRAEGRLADHAVEHLEGSLIDADGGVVCERRGAGDHKRGGAPLLDSGGVARKAAENGQVVVRAEGDRPAAEAAAAKYGQVVVSHPNVDRCVEWVGCTRAVTGDQQVADGGGRVAADL